MWCRKYECITTLVTECEKGCFMCEYCERADGEEEEND